jgi:phosphoglycerate dehydrogenase-like enzyme
MFGRWSRLDQNQIREAAVARIAILDDYQNVALTMADWSGLVAAHEVRVFNHPFDGIDAAATALAGFEVICIMRERTPFSRAMFERLPALKLLVTTGHRNAAIDMQAAADKKVVVCGTDASGHATAELAMGLILALMRNIPLEAQAMREGRWQTTVGRDLRGRTLGIIGLGRLGAELAGFGRAFGMGVIAWSQNLTAEQAIVHGVTRVEKDALFQQADVISIHTKLSARTTGLVGARELGLMKSDALLINTSRGPIVDEVALLAALQAGRIGGAGIDVYATEPVPNDHPLRRCPRTVLTPHIGYVTQESYRVFYGGTVKAVEAWLKGAPIHVMGA